MVANDLINLNPQGFVRNLFAVTTGNIFGGRFMVAVVYWFIYRRPRGRRFEARQVLDLFRAYPAVRSPSARSQRGTQAVSVDRDDASVEEETTRP
jgi:hypothetical protein